MRIAPILVSALALLASGVLWMLVARGDDPAAKVKAARERAERVRSQGDLPWEDPDGRAEFEWLQEPGLQASVREASFGDGETGADSEREPEGASANVELGPRLNCELIVRGPDGEALGQTPVSVRAIDSEARAMPRQLQTDSEGRVEISAPAGRYRLLTYLGEAEFRVASEVRKLEVELAAAR